jgi:hypothetical protein
MEPLAVDLWLMRSAASAELRIAPGRVLMARVVRPEGVTRGALSIAGEVIEAELPAHLRAGDQVRLVVRDVTAGRVLLRLMNDAPPQAAPPAVALPGGGTVRVSEREERTSGSSPATTTVVSLRYEAPALGAVDLRFELDPQSLSVSVLLPAGEPHRLAQEHADALRDALAAGVDRPIRVTIAARREPLDVYA